MASSRAIPCTRSPSQVRIAQSGQRRPGIRNRWRESESGIGCRDPTHHRGRPRLRPPGKLLHAQTHVELVPRDVNVDDVARFEQADWTAGCDLGADVPDAGPRSTAGEPTIGNQGHLIVEPDSLDCRGRREHLLLTRPIAWPFVADHHNVAGFHFSADDPDVSVRLRLGNHGRTRVPEHLGPVANRPNHRARRGQVAAEDR